MLRRCIYKTPVQLILLLIILTSCQCVAAFNEESRNYDDDGLPSCGWTDGSVLSVCDPDHILDGNQVTELDFILEKINKSVGCLCYKGSCTFQTWRKGILAKIVILKNVSANHRFTFSSTSEKIRQYAEYLVTSSFLPAVCDNNMVIVLSTQEHMLATAVGFKTKRELPESCMQAVEKNVTNILQQGQYFRTLKTMLNLLLDSTKGGTYLCPGPAWWITMIIVVVGCVPPPIVIIIIMVCMVRARRQRQRQSND